MPLRLVWPFIFSLKLNNSLILIPVISEIVLAFKTGSSLQYCYKRPNFFNNYYYIKSNYTPALNGKWGIIFK